MRRFFEAQGVKINIKTPRKDKTLPKYLKESELKKLLNAPDPTNIIGLRGKTILNLLYSSGLRVSELLNLNVDDLDLEGNTIKIMKGKGVKDSI